MSSRTPARLGSEVGPVESMTILRIVGALRHNSSSGVGRLRSCLGENLGARDVAHNLEAGNNLADELRGIRELGLELEISNRRRGACRRRGQHRLL